MIKVPVVVKVAPPLVASEIFTDHDVTVSVQVTLEVVTINGVENVQVDERSPVAVAV